VPVVIALKFFQPAYESDPLLLQYAMRVLEQHPVSVTFFYTPQVVQALRTDELGGLTPPFWCVFPKEIVGA
jgi:phosphatidylinositol 4-kinase A